MLRIKLVKSPIGNNWRNRRTVAALGLRKVHQVVEQPDNSSIRGMIHHVQHLVTFEVIEGEHTPKPGKSPAKAAAPKAEPKKAVAKSKPEASAAPKKAPVKAEAKAKAPAKAKKTEEKA
jgi:large subunit ribosomal protein L30